MIWTDLNLTCQSKAYNKNENICSNSYDLSGFLGSSLRHRLRDLVLESFLDQPREEPSHRGEFSFRQEVNKRGNNLLREDIIL